MLCPNAEGRGLAGLKHRWKVFDRQKSIGERFSAQKSQKERDFAWPKQIRKRDCWARSQKEGLLGRNPEGRGLSKPKSVCNRS